MKIKDIMCQKADYVNKDATVTEIARKMKSDNCGAILIADKDIKDKASGKQGKLIGCVTDRDIALKVVAEGIDPDSVTAQQIMSSPVYYRNENDDATDVAENMAQQNVLRMVVVDDSKSLTGIISHGDLADAAAKDGFQDDSLTRSVTGLACKYSGKGAAKKAA